MTCNTHVMHVKCAEPIRLWFIILVSTIQLFAYFSSCVHTHADGLGLSNVGLLEKCDSNQQCWCRDRIPNYVRLARGVFELSYTVLPPREKPQTLDSRWRSLWKRDIPLHLGGEGKGIISFGADGTGGSLISLCASVENELLA
ncbi:hypothetical protein AVEN_128292-1 [Araneus ventricosus]|uniref:Uncharacterized protein n=1 Tax=Araneus ventricosus TaxID=182803 RepID=A0A4Y2K4F8_ARAVE|nr:hypothetical protein AVEN_128292-1 [Araneus ventricosus]